MRATEQPVAKPRRSARRWLVVVGLVLVAGLALAVLVGIGTSKRVRDGGMRPALHPGDRVLVDGSAYHQHQPRRFDIVALHPTGGGALTFSRVVGLPGDRVQLRADGAYVEPSGQHVWYLVHPSHPAAEVPITLVPTGKYFVLGDSEAGVHGVVDRTAISGRVSVRVWPPGGIGGRPKLVPLS